MDILEEMNVRERMIVSFKENLGTKKNWEETLKRKVDSKKGEREPRERPLRGVINSISKGFDGGGATTSARKRYV